MGGRIGGRAAALLKAALSIVAEAHAEIISESVASQHVSRLHRTVNMISALLLAGFGFGRLLYYVENEKERGACLIHPGSPGPPNQLCVLDRCQMTSSLQAAGQRSACIWEGPDLRVSLDGSFQRD
ncbi:unnamed protein product [Merluccius merluccius]